MMVGRDVLCCGSVGGCVCTFFLRKSFFKVSVNRRKDKRFGVDVCRREYCGSVFSIGLFYYCDLNLLSCIVAAYNKTGEVTGMFYSKTEYYNTGFILWLGFLLFQKVEGYGQQSGYSKAISKLSRNMQSWPRRKSASMSNKYCVLSEWKFQSDHLERFVIMYRCCF